MSIIPDSLGFDNTLIVYVILNKPFQRQKFAHKHDGNLM